ncbi:MAG: hypothetical protein JJU21_06635 [Salinarimonas sp.]|nr:hypothetical protein [Salinarimonas sp.]
MMALPFLISFIGLAFAWGGHRGWALGSGLLAIATTLALFRLHATDSLALSF